MSKEVNTGDWRIRYSREQRIEFFLLILGCIQKHHSNIPVSLCMEESYVVHAVGQSHTIGKCICPL